MALIKCRECGHEVSSRARNCIKCGIKRPSKTSHNIRGLIYGSLFLFFLYAGFTGGNKTNGYDSVYKNYQEKNSKQNNHYARASLNSPKPYESKWYYSNSKDELSSGTIYSASISSNNKVNLKFPYQGEQRASLQLRNHPRFGRDVIFRLNKAQILCHSYSACNILVRFDGENAVNYRGGEPSDHSTNYVFINNYQKFISKLLRAEKVKIAVDLYQNGTQTFEFDTKDFDVEQYKSSNRKISKKVIEPAKSKQVAKIVKYRDSDGNIRLVNDISKVPERYRKSIETGLNLPKLNKS